MSCDWCDGEGCDECGGKKKKTTKKPAAKKAPPPKDDFDDDGFGGGGDDGVCSWCDGEGCDECGKKKSKKGKETKKKEKAPAKKEKGKKVCDWCDGAGCDACGASESTGGPADVDVAEAGAEKCDFCDGSGCDQCSRRGEEPEITLDVKLANHFYEAEDERSTNAAKALESFRKIVELAKPHQKELNDESQTTVFKSLQNIVGILFTLKKEQEALKAYKDLLDYFSNVSQNERDGAVDAILNQTATYPEALREQLYSSTGEALEKMADKGNMLFSIQMRQCHELAAKQKFKETIKLLEKIHSRCRLSDGRDDQKSKGSELIEIYALRLKIAAQTKDMLKTKELYEKTKDLTAAVKNPKSQSIIKECWGKMFGDQGQWARAYTEFFSAFTSYQEAGDPESAKQCLKYVVVANMLAKGEQNPMAAREARVYANDPEITPIVQLRAAYDKRDVEAFGKCLQAFYRTADDYIQSHMNSTVDEFQRLTALKILKSYKRIHIGELAVKLQISQDKTEELLIQLILDGKLGGKIDQVKGILDLSQRGAGADADKYNSLETWSTFLDSHSKNMSQPTGGRGFNPMMMGW